MTPSHDRLGDVVEVLKLHLKRPLRDDDLQEERALSDLGLDSISVVEILLELEKRFQVPASQLLDGQPITVGRIARHLSTAPQ